MNTKERTLIEVTEANFDAEVIKAIEDVFQRALTGDAK